MRVAEVNAVRCRIRLKEVAEMANVRILRTTAKTLHSICMEWKFWCSTSEDNRLQGHIKGTPVDPLLVAFKYAILNAHLRNLSVMLRTISLVSYNAHYIQSCKLQVNFHDTQRLTDTSLRHKVFVLSETVTLGLGGQSREWGTGSSFLHSSGGSWKYLAHLEGWRYCRSNAIAYTLTRYSTQWQYTSLAYQWSVFPPLRNEV